MSDYPEHDKLKAISDQSQAQGAFLDWLQSEKGYDLCGHEELDDYEAGWFPVRESIQKLLAEYHEIDLNRLEEEKLAMLEACHTLHEAKETFP